MFPNCKESWWGFLKDLYFKSIFKADIKADRINADKRLKVNLTP